MYSLLEGLLRRKNSEYVNKEGKTIQPFQLNRKNKNNQNYGRFKINKSINSIPLLFQILEELTIPIHRSHRQITGLRELESESASFINDSKDFYESIYAGRNSLLHGEKYWQTRVPILMNLICLLLVDSIDPLDYNANINEYRTYLDSYLKLPSTRYWNGISRNDELLKQEIFYPPNIDF